MRFRRHTRKACLLIDTPRGHQHIVGPERQGPIALVTSKLDAGINQPAPQAEAARGGLDIQQPKLGHAAARTDHERGADDEPVALRDPTAFGRRVEVLHVAREDLSHQRADDAPAYITMFIVGHFIVAGVLSAEEFWPNSSIWLVAILACALATLATLWLLPRIKGALIGYQWAMRMHGFGGTEKEFI